MTLEGLQSDFKDFEYQSVHSLTNGMESWLLSLEVGLKWCNIKNMSDLKQFYRKNGSKILIWSDLVIAGKGGSIIC